MSSPSIQTPSPATSAALADETFQTEQVLTIAGGHFIHDTFSAFIAPLLPQLQERLATNYTLTGSLAIYAQLPSLLNPFIGYLADKVSLRYFIILAPGITATLMSSLGLVSSYAALAILLLLSGVSIAAFHAPAPAMIGRISGPRLGTGMSIFMASGELGRTVGPLLVAAGVAWFGLEGLWRLVVIGWLATAVLYVRLRHIPAATRALDRGLMLQMLPKARRIFPILAWLMLTREFMLVAITIFLPLFMTDILKADLWLSAQSLTILEGAGVVGALLMGTLSDRLGRGRILLILLATAPLLMVAFLFSPPFLTALILIALGFTAISAMPVLLAIVQEQFPDMRALANGMFLALSFLIRALAIWIIGLLADRFGLFNAFLWSGLVAWFSLPALWFLPNRAKT